MKSRMKKGTLDIEFMLSVFVFLAAVTFVSVFIINNIPRLHAEALSQDMKSKAFQLSELLMFDTGEPADWQDRGLGSVKRFGLSTGARYNMYPAKAARLEEFCAADYERVKDLLGLDFRNDVIIEIKEAGGGLRWSCAPPVVSEIRPRAAVARVALVGGTRMIMEVSVL